MYDNGASVDTSFVTNMGQYKIMVAPDLYEAIKAADDETARRLQSRCRNTITPTTF